MKKLSNSRPYRRLIFLAAALLFAFCAERASATGPALTTVNDIVYRANGQVASGSLVISWPSFTTADQKPVAAGELSVNIGAGGALTVALTPNEGAAPSGTFYKVVYKLNDSSTSVEYWTVPSVSPTTISAIRASVVPSQIGAQVASKQYVDSALAGKVNDDAVVHKTGNESVAGVKTFSASPVVPSPATDGGAANKSYVDSAISGLQPVYIKKSGDSMTGVLNLSGDPVNQNHAANKQYVDANVGTLTAELSQKLGRLGDTPITLGSVRYVTTLTNAGIQAAVDAVSEGGTVFMPAGTYDITGTVTIAKRMKLMGAGWGTVLQVGLAVGSSTDIILLKPPSAAAVEGIHLQDFYIKPVSGTPARYGINIDGTNGSVSNLVVERVRIDTLGNYGIAVTNTSGVTSGTPKNATIRDNILQAGMDLSYVANGLNLENNVIGGNTQYLPPLFNGYHYDFLYGRKTTESYAPDHYFPLAAVNWQASGGLNTGGKTKPYAAEFTLWKQATGEGGVQRSNAYCGGDGDCIGNQVFTWAAQNCLEAGGECSEGARLHVEQNSTMVTTGTIFVATDNGSSWELTYSSGVADMYAGINRYVINTTGAKTYTAGTVSTIAGTPPTVTFNAADTSRDSWFAALGYSSGVDKTNPAACLRIAGDDFNGVKFVIPVRRFTTGVATMVLGYDGAQGVDAGYPITTAGGAYTLYPCGKTTAVDYQAKSFTVNEGATNWAAADTLEMPLGYAWHAEGLRVVINAAIPNASVKPTNGITIVNLGRPAKAAIHLPSGTWARGLDLSGATFTADISGIGGGVNFGAALSGSSLAGLKFESTGASTNIAQVTGTGINARFRYNDTTQTFAMGSSSVGDKFSVHASTGDTTSSGRFRNSVITSFASGDTTPSVASSNLFKTANSAATTITAFDDGITGQRITILFTDANTTVTDGGSVKLQGAANFLSTADDTMTLVFDGTSWFEEARSVN